LLSKVCTSINSLRYPRWAQLQERFIAILFRSAGSADGYTKLPTYLVLAAMSSWLGYAACVLHRIDLIVLDAIGVAFQSGYLVVFWRYSGIVERRCILCTYFGIIGSIAALYVILFAVVDRETESWNSKFAPACAAAITISMFASPARAMYDAVVILDASRVPQLLSLGELPHSS